MMIKLDISKVPADGKTRP